MRAGESISAAFTIEGAQNKQVLIRAAGPALLNFGVPQVMIDPKLELRSGLTGEILGANDDWHPSLASLFSSFGAFSFPSGSKDAALVVDLPPGTYRAIVRGAENGGGTVLVEIMASEEGGRIVYANMRGHVGIGPSLHGGVYAAFDAPEPILFRALGPSLSETKGAPDPKLKVFDSGGSILAANDNWSGDDAISALAERVGASVLPPASADAAASSSVRGAMTVVGEAQGQPGQLLLEVYQATDDRAAEQVPAFVTGGEWLQAHTGIPAVLEFLATGRPAPAYRFQRSFDGGANWQNVDDSGGFSGATTNRLSFTPTPAMLRQQFRLVATNTVGAATSDVVTVASGRLADDFNGDGHRDILLTNRATGERRIRLLNKLATLSEVNLGTVPVEWLYAGSGDFNGDGDLDLVWQHRYSGRCAIWLMAGLQWQETVEVPASRNIRIAAVADMNNDGWPDLVMQNQHDDFKEVWVMDGTQVVNKQRIYLPLGGAEARLIQASDFNQDGHADYVMQWRDYHAVLDTHNGVAGHQNWLAEIKAPWTIVGIGDFNQDGHLDVVWQNSVTNAHAVWLMNGYAQVSTAYFAAVPSAWSIGTRPELFAVRPLPGNDLDGDSHADLLWQNTQTGQRLFWTMTRTNYKSSVPLTTVSPFWEIALLADFNGDGHKDLLWQHTLTGERRIWLMTLSRHVGTIELDWVPAAWRAVASGDFDRDGNADIVWQNNATGERVIWLMKGSTYLSTVRVGTFAHSWQIVGVADFNHDGYSDLVWQNVQTGETSLWLMQDGRYRDSQSLGTVPSDWIINGAADLTGDGDPDLLFSNNVTGERALWRMSGLTYQETIRLGTASVEWRLTP